MAGYSTLFASALVATAVGGIATHPGNEEVLGRSVFVIVWALFHATYAAVEFITLLQPRVARRFR